MVEDLSWVRVVPLDSGAVRLLTLVLQHETARPITWNKFPILILNVGNQTSLSRFQIILYRLYRFLAARKEQYGLADGQVFIPSYERNPGDAR